MLQAPLNAGGLTPATVKATPLSQIVCPIMAGSAFRRRVQNLWLSTTSGAATTEPEQDAGSRPRRGPMPKTSK
jgi:hypothetical protein